MPRALQIIVTENFAGAERYVATLSAGLTSLGWDVDVVGGSQDVMPRECGPAVVWRRGGSLRQAAKAVASAGRFDVCHVHMTYAEAVAAMTKPLHRATLISTRHFAAARGSSSIGRLIARPLGAAISAEIAISDFVASSVESPPTVVIPNGVAARRMSWRPENRTVLVMQRLEAEKETATALEAWRLSGLASEGWRLRVVGTGSARDELEQVVRAGSIAQVEFAGWVSDVDAELSDAGLLLATASREPLGLSVLEAMSAGVPVVAAAGGGHLETVGRLPDAAVFEPGSAAHAAQQLRALALNGPRRTALSTAGALLCRAEFSLESHVRAVAELYDRVRAERRQSTASRKGRPV